MMKDVPGLIHEFTYNVVFGPAYKIGAGPYGDRQYHEMIRGSVAGRRLTGGLLGSGGDWMLAGPDGFMRMDVRIQIETNDGAIICAHYFGPAEANETFVHAVSAFAPTDFADQSIRSHWLLETGAPAYAWVNQCVFVGQGRLQPPAPGELGFEHRVYRVA